MTPGHAHALSLPLYTLLQRLEGHQPSEASLDIQRAIKKLNLDNDLSSIIVITTENTSISVESKTLSGQAVLDELKARSHFLPCPEGECEYGLSNICQWCGGQK